MNAAVDEQFMRLALKLAANGSGRTSPNPMVGAVIVNNGQVVGQGWHQKAGTPHAEINALSEAGESANGATIYVTLEPCCHHGRTGPCTEALIRAGIVRVVVAMTDPNPLVAGHGLQRLRDAGIEVVDGILANEAAKLNEVFIKWISTGMPFTVLKAAMTLDGKIATVTGRSKWITGEESRTFVHTLRNRYDGIMVGIGTVLADDPELNVRMVPVIKHPTRIILDTHARIPLNAKVLTDHSAKTIIVVQEGLSSEKIKCLEAAGAEVIAVSTTASGLDLKQLFSILGKKGITSILVEGGATVNAAVLEAGLIDKVYWFIAPKFIGGKNAPGPIAGIGNELNSAWKLEDIAVHNYGQDICISGYYKGRVGRDVYRTCGRIRDC